MQRMYLLHITGRRHAHYTTIYIQRYGLFAGWRSVGFGILIDRVSRDNDTRQAVLKLQSNVSVLFSREQNIIIQSVWQ